MSASDITANLTAQQLSFRGCMIADLIKAYQKRGCCLRVVLEHGSDFQRMEYRKLVSYWSANYPARKVPTGAEPDAKKW